MQPAKKLSYKETGVDYDAMDPLKRMAQIAGKKTAKNLTGSSFVELKSSRGESAYVVEQKDSYLAFVMEGLGTKSLVADEMKKITGKTYYDSIAQDTVAMIINDLITVGARPINILAYWAAGSARWFEDKKRMGDLVNGWKKACDVAGVVWGGGETPTLSGIIEPETIDLGGSSFGIIKPKKRLALGEKLQAGDKIILFESSGIHANGLSLARKIAKNLPKGYATKMPDGKMYGEDLLTPTIIYSKLIQDLFLNNVDIHYMAHITGHGWRKIMRYTKPFTYRIHTIPPVPEVLKFLCEKGLLDEKEAYGNLNMGAGYAVFIPKKDIEKVMEIARKNKIKAYNAGVVEKGKKQVIIEPKNIVYEASTLKVRV
ncbi:phosphoribosylformylglycinamidine cyclo-ligase [Candidatus Roizmanbacteria bacterium RIFCSPLOWO2_01_FULL_38_12]|uniref:Phosphoribosylformylglycinamidine cyclo-ligase n=1 Tax=Candidatus Roizmanbacteria bacterium RIFCSPLOWO2_01_FULL_38_12 TaxID=1802061 RepID=A0A1F7J110_9BACT|nr:MAG: phosphoribosylformylglycinamidine cyclo-ligase [Candidatus Roizmanbacteria bacterium RIFCSPHIGHO2_01_FULL_38_15]OGK35743.1 MAG: phosphoribosylformylglycinamidine cyclo-ligase [Candidatus Roizmanbacteria bacterium RIFCSPHIGHO2_12_FULL_38_13]OGK49308.1 MAG: phosphoribosylformylglycinamidine cyclo-ligase [Candidatus Roizmanbacteria bacterium RIFCSPLOWO2_01_FULL_38_12]